VVKRRSSFLLGTKVTDSGRSLTHPIGKVVLGRMFETFIEPIDYRPWLDVIENRRSDIFETGVKAIDPLNRDGMNQSIPELLAPLAGRCPIRQPVNEQMCRHFEHAHPRLCLSP
jgi:hypothetical protein